MTKINKTYRQLWLSCLPARAVWKSSEVAKGPEVQAQELNCADPLQMFKQQCRDLQRAVEKKKKALGVNNNELQKLLERQPGYDPAEPKGSKTRHDALHGVMEHTLDQEDGRRQLEAQANIGREFTFSVPNIPVHDLNGKEVGRTNQDPTQIKILAVTSQDMYKVETAGRQYLMPIKEVNQAISR